MVIAVTCMTFRVHDHVGREVGWSRLYQLPLTDALWSRDDCRHRVSTHAIANGDCPLFVGTRSFNILPSCFYASLHVVVNNKRDVFQYRPVLSNGGPALPMVNWLTRLIIIDYRPTTGGATAMMVGCHQRWYQNVRQQRCSWNRPFGFSDLGVCPHFYLAHGSDTNSVTLPTLHGALLAQ